MNIAVILAGGAGSRMGSAVPKQFSYVAGKPVVAYSVETFAAHSLIDEIAVVVPRNFVEEMHAMSVDFGWTKVRQILTGGDERYKSAMAAIAAYVSQPDAALIFHDAARPLVSSRIIDDILQTLHSYNAVTTAIPTADTILQAVGEVVTAIPDRQQLRRIQTPQAFRLSVIRDAYTLAAADAHFCATDECGVVKKYLPHEKIGIVHGDERNFKLTCPQDLLLLEALIKHGK
jgi:2-C-methyl-D-erythritol 4-phosphate cytidylyltransferase